MKNFAILFGLLIAAGSTLAQQPTTTVQMRCRDFAPTGDALGPEETLVNGMACHAIKQVAVPANAQVWEASPTPVGPSVSPQAPVTAMTLASATSASMKIVPGSKVYIAPMEGFENYLAAALGKKKVQLVPVADQRLADYVITGTSVDKKAGWAKIVVMGNIHSDNAASITMTDRRTGAIVYAEACAKHLEAHIEGHD